MLSRIPHRHLLLNRPSQLAFSIRASTRKPIPSIQPLRSTSAFSTSTTTSTSHPMADQSEPPTPTQTLTPSALESTLQSKLATSHVEVQDMSGGCGQAFTAVIVSEQFAGKSALQRHRLVNGALRAEIAAIHAWTPRCLTPEQWEKEQGK